MNERFRDLEEKLKKSKNRSDDNLGTGKRLNLGSLRRIIEDDDKHYESNENRNEEQTQGDKEDSGSVISHQSQKTMFPLQLWLTTTKSGIHAYGKGNKSLCMPYLCVFLAFT